MSLSARRAWIEIAVYRQSDSVWQPSLSARRAWIEICISVRLKVRCKVALRKESVDRNILHIMAVTGYCPSLSARRAWIEI